MQALAKNQRCEEDPCNRACNLDEGECGRFQTIKRFVEERQVQVAGEEGESEKKDHLLHREGGHFLHERTLDKKCDNRDRKNRTDVADEDRKFWHHMREIFFEEH